ncbi:hypothetical protein N9J59_03700, partial [Gammaproteobacteria bacterium]|nr:hypothetical protein [Gammaproteobacteria bacterium]
MSKEFDKDLYYISNEWIPLYRENMSDLIDGVCNRDPSDFRVLLQNFFREDFSNGLVGLPMRNQKIFQNPSVLNKHWYLNDAFYRIEHLRQKIPNVDLKDLGVSNSGNPFGVFIDDVFVRVNSDYQYYFSNKICKTLEGVHNPVVLEIGGGFGGTALFLKRQLNSMRMYVNLDLPETLMVATY